MTSARKYLTEQDAAFAASFPNKQSPHIQKNRNNMAQLNLVIGAILRDIISAQHEANLYSISLNESYGKDGKAKDFQLPNVVLSDMELELKYAVVGTSDNQEQYNISYSRFRRFIKELCGEAAKTVITSVISSILTSSIQRNEDDKQFFYHLKQEEELNRRFNTFLSHNMLNAFANGLYESVDGSTGNVKVDVVCKKLMNIVRRKFLNDNDLDSLFSDTDGKALRQEADENAQAALEGLVKKMSEDANFKRRKTFPVLDVAVTASELEQIPEEAVHSFKLKFCPTAVTMSEPDEEADLEDFVME